MRTRCSVSLLSVLVLCFGPGCFTPILDFGSIGQVSPLVEVRVSGDAAAKVALLEVSGVIAFDQSSWSFFGGQKPSVISRLQEALDLAATDPAVKGLVLRVRSPGGGVAASETLHHLIKTWQLQTHKPVVAFLQEIAASGGYYVAMASDHVIAHPSSITGSIGVIMPGYNLANLMDRFGVEDQSLTSGAFKDAGSATRPMREDERAQLQSVIDDLFSRFVDVVDEGRPKLDRFAVERLADGRIYTANQALESGLIDEIGHMDAAIDRLKQIAGVSSVQLVTYKEPGASPKNIYSDFSNRAPNLPDLSLISLGAKKIPAGFYYLWPAAVSH